MPLFIPPTASLITAGAFAATADQQFLNLADYRYIKLNIKGSRPATDNVDARIAFSLDNGSSWTAATLVGNRISVTGTTVSGSVITVTSNAMNLNYATGIGNAAGEGIWAQLEIEGFNQAAQKVIDGNFSRYDPSTVLASGNISAFTTDTNAFNAMRLIYSSGNLAAIGQYELWGIKG